MEKFCELYKKYAAGKKYLDGMAGQAGLSAATDRFLERVIIPMRDLWHSSSADDQRAMCAAIDVAEKFNTDSISFKKKLTIPTKGDKV